MILPSFIDTDISSVGTSPTVMTIPKEYGIDFDTGQLTGKIVEGKEAIKVWVWNCLHTSRFRYGIHSWNFGWNPEEYIGQGVTLEYIQADAESEIEEALMVNQYITGIDDFTAELNDGALHIGFTVLTEFGSVGVDYDV